MSKLAKLLDRPEAAQAALQVLDQFGSEVEPIMIQALSNSMPAVRGDAAMFLAYRKSAAPEVVPGLVRALKDSDAEVRARVAMMLSQFQSKAEIVVPALIAALDDSEPLVQGHAAQSLGVFGDRAKGAVPKLIELARGKPSTAAANALARIDPEKAKELGLRGWLLPPETFPAILR
jgi:HEAT repeat protein